MEDCSFQGSLETHVRLCQYVLTQSVMGISKFIKDHYCAVFQSHSLSMFHAV